MHRTYAGVYHYRGPLGQRSRCYLHVFEGDPGTLPVVIATELPDNPGTSITNSAALVASQVWRELLPQAQEGLRYFEHYLPRHPDARGRATVDEDMDEVNFTIIGRYRLVNPVWHRSGRVAVEALIGAPLQLPVSSVTGREHP